MPREVVLDMHDIDEPFVPDPLAYERRRQLLPLQDLLVHTHDENLLVVGPVEDPYPPTLGEALGIALHEVVREVLRRGLFEQEYRATLRIYA